MMLRQAIALSAILALAAALRLVALTDTPLGPNQDEISNALDVDSLRQSGTDHRAEALPIYFRGFGDYREGLFLYLSIPLSILVPAWVSLRVTSVLVGIATVGLAYLLGKRLFGREAGVWSALFLATNPQHILWSRLGMEVILVPFAVTIAWLAFLRVMRGGRGALMLLAGAIVFVIYAGMIGKPAAGILAVSFFVPILGTFFAGRLSWTSCLLAVVLLGILSAPAIIHSLSPEGTSRFKSIRINGDSPGDVVRGVTRNYLTYWSPRQQLAPHSEGMPTWPAAPKRGYAEWLALMVGLAMLALGALLRHGPDSSNSTLPRASLLLFAGLAFLPAAVTDSIAPSRVVFAAPVFSVIAGIGVSWLASRLPAMLVWSATGIGVAITVALISYDITLGSQDAFNLFFWNDERRLAERLATDEGPNRFVDVTIPFIETYAQYAREQSASQWPISLTDWERVRPQPGKRVLTWAARPTPGWKEVARDGRFKIVESP